MEEEGAIHNPNMLSHDPQNVGSSPSQKMSVPLLQNTTFVLTPTAIAPTTICLSELLELEAKVFAMHNDLKPDRDWDFLPSGRWGWSQRRPNCGWKVDLASSLLDVLALYQGERGRSNSYSSQKPKQSSMGKVHGSLARARKVRGQMPKVVKQDKKKKARGRAHKHLGHAEKCAGRPGKAKLVIEILEGPPVHFRFSS
ncbi:hypothetical protein HHK36_006601 [Tetracentron sinense]|uniref:Uncharacterized protein n=1 Tax=Tetracentron sinense TaxID=13715 RepID=A0A834ZLU4_TETSI|nr:hypothetical protein HHK36_006601 [Tetracentron sinense]